MKEFGLNEMQQMQEKLQYKYKDQWEPISPATGKNKMLWMIGELGEVIDIVKKNGHKEATKNEELREELVEELADVLMYYNDILACYGITTAELREAYIAKFESNMKRW